MVENSKIEWTTHTFNPWIECSKVSPGCQHCYTEQLMDLRYGKVQWGPQGTRQRTSESNWKLPLRWNKQAQREGRRYRVFCASLADVFDDRDEILPWRADLLGLIERTRHLDWLVLTKRPENVNLMITHATGRHANAWLADCNHVWIGASVESQETLLRRVPFLCTIRSSIRFLSIEPLLGPIDIKDWMTTPYLRRVDWVIVGGESGPNARPMNPEWARSLRDQCVNAGVPFLFKQWGEWAPGYEHPFADAKHGWFHGTDPSSFVPSCDCDNGCSECMFRVGKKAAGRLLDGREWNEVPEVTTNDS